MMGHWDKFAAGIVFGALLALAAAYSDKAKAADDVWLSATIASYHSNRNIEHNERNWGLGFEYGLSDNWRAVGGAYRNSYWRTSAYAGLLWLPVRVGPFRAGTTLAGATGYNGPVDLVVMPTIAWEGKQFGVNLGVMPAIDRKIVNVIGLQLKARF